MNDQTETFELNEHALDELSFYYKTSSAVAGCVRFVESMMVLNSSLSGTSLALNKYYAEFCSSFVRAALHDLFVLGWIVYRMEERDGGIMFPVFVPNSAATVKITRKKKGAASVHVSYAESDNRGLGISNNSTKARKTYVFFVNNIHEYCSDTMISSPMLGLINDFRIYTQLLRFQIQSDYVRSNPTVYLHGRPLSDFTRHLDGGVNQDAPAFIGPYEDTQFSVNDYENATKTYSSNITFHESQEHAASLRARSNFRKIGLDVKPQYKHNIFVCPPDTTLAHAPVQPISPDVKTAEERLEKNINAQFGVAAAFVTNNYRHSTIEHHRNENDNEFTAVLFSVASERYANLLRELFNDVYLRAFENSLPNSCYVTIHNIFASHHVSAMAQREQLNDEANNKTKDDSTKDDSTKDDSTKDDSTKDDSTNDNVKE
jgi:hypothetical protein